MQVLPNNDTKRSQASGELAPHLWGHTDQQKYESGLRTCRNTLVLRQGVTANRNGTSFVGTAHDQTEPVRLFRFIRSTSVARLLVFSPGYIQVVLNGAFIPGIAVQVPYQASDLFDLYITQSADVITIVHPNYPPAELQRESDVMWVYVVKDFGPAIVPPTNVGVRGIPSAEGTVWQYAITAIKASTLDESLPSTPPGVFLVVQGFNDPETGPHTVEWTPVAGAVSYNVYLSTGFGGYGLLGSAPSAEFINTGIVPDVTTVPPTDPMLFQAAGDYPSTVGYYQQRLVLGNSLNNPTRVWASRSGRFANFTISTPTQEDDSVVFDLVSGEVSAVRHFIDLGRLLIGTEGSEWLADGDTGNVLSPTAINARIGSYNGASKLPPLKVDFNVLYVQSLGVTVRKLKANILYGYYTFENEDLTLFSSHLFENYTLVDWTWAQQPNFCVWAVRSDGTLLGMTFIPEQQLEAWHRHDTTNGAFESVAAIPEGGEHAVYVVVRRVINGQTVRYIERFNSRPAVVADIVRNARFMDASLSYDGTNTSACIMTISGGGPDIPPVPYLAGVGQLLLDENGVPLQTEDGQFIYTEGNGVQVAIPAQSGWGAGVQLTLTCSCGQFSQSDIGGAYFITGPDGTLIRFFITGVTSPTIATGTPDKTVPASMRNVAFTAWARAVALVGGLQHLEGQAVSIYGDGGVVANPNNDDYEVRVVKNGQVALDQPYAVICVGLPYFSDVQTLDIDMPRGPTAKGSRMDVTAVGLYLNATRGLFIGGREPLQLKDGLVELKLRDTTAMGLSQGQPVSPVTKYVEQAIESEWNSNGRVFIRQLDPVPCEVLSITALGNIPVGAV